MDFDYSDDDDLQNLLEGRHSDDDKYFTKKSTDIKKSQTQLKRKRDSFEEDENEFINEIENKNIINLEDRYDDNLDIDDDDDPVNPFDEAEEEIVKPKKVSKPENTEEKKKKNVIRNPRILLDEEKLKSKEGVLSLPELFKDYKYKGKNHEKEDLNHIMSVYQTWAHRLMPSLQFDDFIEKCESICKKAKMKVFLTKMRSDSL